MVSALPAITVSAIFLVYKACCNALVRPILKLPPEPVSVEEVETMDPALEHRLTVMTYLPRR